MRQWISARSWKIIKVRISHDKRPSICWLIQHAVSLYIIISYMDKTLVGFQEVMWLDLDESCGTLNFTNISDDFTLHATRHGDDFRWLSLQENRKQAYLKNCNITMECNQATR